jgi:hypothetical protein
VQPSAAAVGLDCAAHDYPLPAALHPLGPTCAGNPLACADSLSSFFHLRSRQCSPGCCALQVTHHVINSTAKLAHAALAVPRLLAPEYRHLGRQVYLRSVPAVLGAGGGGWASQASGTAAAEGSESATSQPGQGAGYGGAGGGAGGGWSYLALGDDPLLPLRVSGRSPLAMHRMISYRARMMDLFFLHQLQLQA